MHDIVRFKRPITEAGMFCKTHGITGKIVASEHKMLIIDVGFEYKVYAHPDEIELVVKSHQAPLGSDE